MVAPSWKFITLLALVAQATVQNLDDAKNRPVAKVITVLKEMVEQLEKEGEEDEETYEAMGCWCETNDKELTKSIQDAESSISSLTALIEELTATSSRLNTEISKLDEEVAKNTQALDTATAMRKKEKAEFQAEEKDSIQATQSLKNAIIALSKHHEASLLQTTESAQVEIDFITEMSTLRSVLRKHAEMLSQQFTASQRSKIASFAQNPDQYIGTSLSQTSYNPSQVDEPASGEIFGLLKQMKESFETNLANSQKDETNASEEYENLKATKTEEIDAGESQLEKKTSELAMTDEKNAQSKEDLEDTQNSLAADTEFLATVKSKCEALDAEYEERTSTRQMEIAAVGKALAFLNSDEAHDLFSRTLSFSQSFLQTGAANQREKIQKILSVAAAKSKDTDLLQLQQAAKEREDAFAKVRETIQGMVDKLTKEQEDEVKLKEFCVIELDKNEKETQIAELEKADLEAKVEDLENTIDTLSKQIEGLKQEIAELQVNMKRSGEEREKTNKEFQIAIADQRATQKLLGKALGILKEFYDKMSLVQKQPSPAPEFKKYEKNAKSGGVMGMMQSIINDAKALEYEALRGEEDTQKAYEDFVKDSNESIDAKIKETINLGEVKAKAESDLMEAKQELEAVLDHLEALLDENADLHKRCDFTLKNFDLRQTSRGDEIQALKESIAMFGGAAFSAFLQNGEQMVNGVPDDSPDSDDSSDSTLYYDGSPFKNARSHKPNDAVLDLDMA